MCLFVYNLQENWDEAHEIVETIRWANKLSCHLHTHTHTHNEATSVCVHCLSLSQLDSFLYHVTPDLSLLLTVLGSWIHCHNSSLTFECVYYFYKATQCPYEYSNIYMGQYHTDVYTEETCSMGAIVAFNSTVSPTDSYIHCTVLCAMVLTPYYLCDSYTVLYCVPWYLLLPFVTWGSCVCGLTKQAVTLFVRWCVWYRAQLKPFCGVICIN